MDRYEEALAKARVEYEKARKQGYAWLMNLLEGMFPELKESEDEGIRRHLIDIVETYWGTTNDPGKAADLAWLEKQKAKERLDRMAPIYNDKESFESALEKAWKYYNESASRTVDSFEDDYIECVFSKGFREGFLYREKQKEQIPYIDFVIKPHKGDDTNPYDMSVSEAQEYAIKRGFGIPFNDGEVYVDERHITQTIGNIIRWADEHPKEQNLSESCDNICCGDDRFKIIEETRKDIIEKTNIAENELSMELPLLDGILTRVWQVGWLNKKQKPAEWSKEDEEMRINILQEIANIKDVFPKINIQPEFDWLKSLPERFNLQPKQEWTIEKVDLDLDADIEMEWDSFNKNLAEYGGESEEVVWLNRYNFNEIARYFYELGLNARKEETKQPEVDLEKTVEFECIGKKVKMTVQDLINYYINSECVDVAGECDF